MKKGWRDGAIKFWKFRRTISAENIVEDKKKLRRQRSREERRSQERRVQGRRKQSKEREDEDLKLKSVAIETKEKRVNKTPR